MSLHHLIYLSTPTRPLAPAALDALLMECRTGNRHRGITGVLFYGPQHFLQLIEGEPVAVHDLYAQLQQDGRHHNLIKVADKPVENRAFTDWSMAFRCLGPQVASEGFRPLETEFSALPGLAAADALLLESVRQQLLSE